MVFAEHYFISSLLSVKCDGWCKPRATN